MGYHSHVFYNTQNLDIKEKLSILDYAFKKCYNWRVDVLDCSKSFTRQRVDMPFQDILEKFNNKCHFVVIHRRGTETQNWYIEVGFSTMTDPDYFLWIEIDPSLLDEFVAAFNLTPRQ